jgi:hypothetical protein
MLRTFRNQSAGFLSLLALVSMLLVQPVVAASCCGEAGAVSETTAVAASDMQATAAPSCCSRQSPAEPQPAEDDDHGQQPCCPNGCDSDCTVGCRCHSTVVLIPVGLGVCLDILPSHNAGAYDLSPAYQQFVSGILHPPRA